MTIHKIPQPVQDYYNIRLLGKPYSEAVEENGRILLRKGYIWDGKKYYEKEVDLKDIDTNIGCLAPGEPIDNVTTRPIEFIPIPDNANLSNFFFKGKYFENEQELLEYAKEWPFLKTNQETFIREWEKLGQDILMNINVTEIDLSNGSLNEILQDNFLHLLQKFFGKDK